MWSVCFQILPSNTFWTDWFGNQSKISFEVELKSGISKEDVRKMVVKVSTSVAGSRVSLNVAPPLETFQVRDCPFPIKITC